MSHRAQQIIAQIESLLRASSTLGVSGNVFAFHSLSLADNQGELPAITVNYGNDSPSSLTQYDAIYSDLTVEITAYDSRADELALHNSLLEIRRQIHKALVADSTLNLSFVVSIRYAGAQKPELDATAEQISGRIETDWIVTYAMDQADPGT